MRFFATLLLLGLVYCAVRFALGDSWREVLVLWR